MGKPGTGKTTYLANKILEKMGAGNASEDIFFTSFSRSASRAMFLKLKEQGFIGKDLRKTFGTIYHHANTALAFNEDNYIRRDDYDKFCQQESIEFDAYHFSERKIEDIEEFGLTNDNGVYAEGNILFNWWSLLKLVFIDNDSVKKNMRTYYKLNGQQQSELSNRSIDQIIRFFDEWEAYKNKNNRYEFVDLLQICLMNKYPFPYPFKYVFLDESHDFGPLQMELIKLWYSSPSVEEVYICWDPLQTIYTFTGANPNIVKDIKTDDEPIVLKKSYRVPKIPWEFAKKIAKTLNDLSMEGIDSSDEEGDILFCETLKELFSFDFIRSDETMFFLCRKNVDVSKLQGVFQRLRIPVRGLGKGRQTIWSSEKFKNIYQLFIKLDKGEIPLREEIRSLLQVIPASYLVRGVKQDFIKRRFNIWGKDGFDKEKLIDDKMTIFFNLFKLNVDSLEKLKDLLSQPSIKQLTDCMKDYLLKTNKNDLSAVKVNRFIGTYHSSKGLDADNVILFDYMLNPDWDTSEETRLVYVGVTRTKNRLIIFTGNVDEYDGFVESFY